MSRLAHVAGAVVTAASSERVIAAVTVDYIGVPINVLIACAMGSYCGFAFAPKIEEKGRMCQIFITCMLLGAAFTAMADWGMQQFTDWEFRPGTLAAMGAILSALMRYIMPEIIKRLGLWMDKIPMLKPKEGGE